MNLILRMALLTVAGALSQTINAQVATWLVKPQYDDIHLIDNGLYQVTRNDKNGLIDASGKMILPLDFDSIMPFNENVAVLYNDGNFVAVTNLKGEVADFTGRRFKILPGEKRFRSGFLPVKKEGDWYFTDPSGEHVIGPFAWVSPFSEGKAIVKHYGEKNPQDLVYDIIDSDGNPVFIKTPEKDKFERKDITFISTFDDGRALCVAKKKVYLIDGETFMAQPLATDKLNAKKTQVTVDKVTAPLASGSDYVLQAKNGLFTFDSALRMRRMELDGSDPVVIQPAKVKVTTHRTSLASTEKDGRYGLAYKDTEVLPAQFEKVGDLKDNRAVVATSEGYGILTVNPDDHFVFRLNNNEPIGFHHQFGEGKVTVHMPPSVKLGTARVVGRDERCEIQIDSRREVENIEGNTIHYDCRLTIPSDLSDQLKDYTYTFALKYDGLLSPDYKVKTSAWYVKSYDVDILNSSFAVGPNDVITVEFDLHKSELLYNDHGNYFKKVEVFAGNTPMAIDKITENHFAFRLGNIDSDRINFNVRITEAGCPPINYPFELVFERSRNKKMSATINAVNTIIPEETPAAEETEAAGAAQGQPAATDSVPAQPAPQSAAPGAQ